MAQGSGSRPVAPVSGSGPRLFVPGASVLLAVGLLVGLAPTVAAQAAAGTAFTYQGRLTDAGAPANGPYDLQLALYTADVGGTQVGPTVSIDDLPVVDGLFTVGLDFGPGVFTGDARFLEIGVRPGASSGPYTVLGARQELKPAPHSVFSQEAPWTGISGKPPGFADDIDDDVLGGLVCGSGEVAKWNGTAWACASDADTTYTAGAGLDLTGAAFSVANLGITTGMLASSAVTTAKVADSAVTSAKIADGTIGLADLGQNGCGPDQVVKWTGTAWACATDEDTTYTAGSGLDLTGAVFSVANLGVTTAKLADNAVASPKLADSAVTSAKIADGTIGLADLGQNGCGPDQVVKWNGTAWACAVDVDTNSGGTVTSVGTGAGLTGGPIATTGTVSVASGGITTALLANAAVTSPKIANGAVGLAQINPTQVQARVSGMCPPGQYVRGINSNGSVVCELLFVPPVIATVDNPANFVGSYSSIAIGTDGLPVISYYDQTAQALKVAHCGNAACTAGNTATTVDDPANFVGTYTSIAIGTDGLPVISYYDSTAQALKVAHCGNAACTVGNTLTTVDSSSSFVGQFTSIAIGTDGLPVISYAGGVGLKVAHCGNAACTAGNTLTIVDNPAPANIVGKYTSIAIGTDGLPVISYYDQTAQTMKVAHCGNAACTAGNTATTVTDPSISIVGGFTSIAIGTDGLPVISYYAATAQALQVAHCGNAACTAGNTLRKVDDPANTVGQYNSIAIGTDGLPVISYYDETAQALKVAHCGDATCAAGNNIATVDPAGGQYTSIAIGTDGLPVISYAVGGGLKVAHCGTPGCQ